MITFAPMKLVNETWYLLKKEILLEWRAKYAFNGVLLYVVSTVFVCYISLNLNPGFAKSEGYPIVWNVLFWIIMLFASVNAIAKSFMQESKNRLLYYYSIASPQAIILSKTIYNVLLMGLLSVLALVVYLVFFPNRLGDPLYYFLAVLLGSISFSTVFTMISAIASKAGNNGTLMAILSFPVIIPVILVLIKLSKSAMDGVDRSFFYGNIGVLCAINAIVIATAMLLFPYLWRD
ncbi:heme exporter protein B [Mucilaginibacter oryzae]|uniref:Heme exporter protein B n=2 Tax=Mucilaginibacter oryzae TaxID=468058 RepID=A0A316HC34_9SPHI|nr:heme exporter protein B [Mucilaginibacter oryzae]